MNTATTAAPAATPEVPDTKKTRVIKIEKEVLKDVLPDGSKIRALCVSLFTADGRSAVGLSINFSVTEAMTNAYEVLMNSPIIGGKVAHA